MIWAGFAALTLLCVTTLVWPVMRNSTSTTEQAEADQAIHRAQLSEVEQDLADGLLTEAEAEIARTEVKLRMLAANKRQTDAGPLEAPALRMGTVTAVAVLLPFTTLAVYLTIGSPDLPGAPVAERRADALEHPDQSDLSVLIEQLADRLRADPDSTEGWVLLARSFRQMDRMGEATTAYRRALSTGADDPVVFAEFGEALIAANGGAVTSEAENIFRAVLQTNREEPRARFYLGLARAQAGEVRDAIAIWRDLTASTPPGAPWLTMVRDQMREVAMAASVMPVTITPRHPLDNMGTQASQSNQFDAPTYSGAIPTADDEEFRPDVSALAGRFSGGELEMIQEMVGGLEARLEFGREDFDGWMQLGRSYGVLGDSDKAANAYREAITVRPDAIMPRVQLADLLLRSIGSGQSITGEIVELSENILRLDGSNPDGLFIAGLAAASEGSTNLARERWTRLLDILPPGDSARGAVTRRLAELP